jgi:hypothetical protein
MKTLMPGIIVLIILVCAWELPYGARVLVSSIVGYALIYIYGKTLENYGKDKD